MRQLGARGQVKVNESLTDMHLSQSTWKTTGLEKNNMIYQDEPSVY